ncbi:Myosin 10A, isoform D [Physocladia obscura]|uniref:Myosin 10A, isoform D n=1 Tax=Physocladia obscura TaxID=109957 RepID=A0AAD5T491_9FUNG|nr:Myosin 10A, isoform D [Physocladia obscura]
MSSLPAFQDQESQNTSANLIENLQVEKSITQIHFQTSEQKLVCDLALCWALTVLGLSKITFKENMAVPAISAEQKQKILDDFRNGILPCKLMNIIQPNLISQISESLTPITSLENLAAFSTALASFGIPKKFIFKPMEYLQANPKGDELFLSNLLRLGILAHKKGFSSPDWFDLQTAQNIIESTQTRYNLNSSISSPQIYRNSALKRYAFSADDDYTIGSKIFQKLVELDETLNETVRKAAEKLNKAQSDNTYIAEELMKNLLIISNRLSQIENTQKVIMNTIETGHRKSFLNKGLHLRSNSSMNSVTFNSEDENKTNSPPISGAVSPKLYAKLPMEVLTSNLPKQDMMRLSVIYELIETESDYIRDLQLIIDLHQREMRASQIVDENALAVIFPNIEQLILTNQKLLDKLNEKKEENPFIEFIGKYNHKKKRLTLRKGDAFLESSEEWADVYTVYCKNYPMAVKQIQQLSTDQNFKKILQQISSSPEARGLSLESFLV